MLGRNHIDADTAFLSAPQSFSSFGSETLLAMDRDSLTTERAQRIDHIAARSKQTFAPTNDIEQFQALSPSRNALQSRLLGSSMIPQPTWSTEGNVDTSTSVPVDTTDAERIATGSMIRSLFASLTSSSPSNSTQSFSE
ncbi:MAG: hypothetical protein ACK5PB_00235, partial [Pirellula sp.]